MKNYVVGIDVSKDKLDICVLQSVDHKVISKDVITNDHDSIADWLTTLDRNEVELAVEHTGHYGALLASMLTEQQFVYFMINPLDLKHCLGVVRGKSDAVDAYRIASYATTHRHKLSPYVLPANELRELKVLMSNRQLLIKIRTQLKNALKANQVAAKSVEVSMANELLVKQIENTKESIDQIDQQMLKVIKSSSSLKKSFDLATSVTGVGKITAIMCITETNNFLKFTDGRKFNCHCGLAPFPYQSGTSVGGPNRTHYLCNKQLKSLLFTAACSAIQHDPQMSSYYNRKLNEGKHKMSVLTAASSKIVLRIFAVIKRQEPYVKRAA